MLTHDKMYAHSWKMAKAKTTELQPLDQVTFKVNINLRSVFDKNGRDDFVPATRYQQSLEDKLDSILLRMDEMQDDINELDDLKVLPSKVDELQQRMSRFEMQHDRNPQRQKLKQWLTEMKLPEYFELFIEHGVEDLATAALLNQDWLMRI